MLRLLVSILLFAPCLVAMAGCLSSQEKRAVCATCGEELPRGGICPDCKRGASATGDKGRKNEPATSRRQDVPFAVKVSIFIASLVALVVLALWGKLGGWNKKPQPTAVFRCPHCKRKVRYPLSRVGQPAKCQRCDGTFVFPEPEPAHRDDREVAVTDDHSRPTKEE